MLIMERFLSWVREWPGKHGYVLEWLDRCLARVLELVAGIVMGCAFIAVFMAVIYIVEVLLNGGQ